MSPRVQCRTYPFWPEHVQSAHDWEAEAARCEGITAAPAAGRATQAGAAWAGSAGPWQRTPTGCFMGTSCTEYTRVHKCLAAIQIRCAPADGVLHVSCTMHVAVASLGRLPWDAGTPDVGERTGTGGNEARHAGSHGGADSGSTPVAAEAGAGSEARGGAAGRSDGGDGATVSAQEVVINLALEEVRRSGEMGGLTYRRATLMRLSAAFASSESDMSGASFSQCTCCSASARASGLLLVCNWPEAAAPPPQSSSDPALCAHCRRAPCQRMLSHANLA